MAPNWLSGKVSHDLVEFSLYPSLFWELIEKQKKLEKFTFFTRKPLSHVRILLLLCKATAHLLYKGNGLQCS